MRVLVTGGAGYIGTHTVVALIEAGHDVVVVDNFVNSKPAAITRVEQIVGRAVPCHDVDVSDREALDAVVTQAAAEGRPIEGVIHFAALKAVGESVAQPLAYYRNNLDSTFALLDVLGAHGISTFVFSSSATVYGSEAPVPYVETFEPLQSASPYGQTKVMIERVLTDVAAADPSWRVALLRYFNPVGAHPSGLIGEDPQGIPNNLMPFIAQVAVGRRDHLAIYGGDYDTADGTCERDFIHVDDLAAGHVRALEVMAERDPGVRAWNLGSGQGTSVLELLKAFERACGRDLPHTIVDRRAGDLAAFWADPSRAEAELGWKTQRSIDDMCADTWRWQSQNPQGFTD